MKEVIIYTDGACTGNPGPGGYGAVLIYKSRRKEIFGGYGMTTNNRMEILAAIKALEALREPCIVRLYSDSRYLVDAIEKRWAVKWRRNGWMRNAKENALNVDLWRRLLAFLDVHSVKFIWIKGHADNKENERCDKLAREAITSGELDIDEGYENGHENAAGHGKNFR